MIYVIFNGEYYLNEAKQAVKKIDNAVLFISEKKANLFLDSSPKSVKNLGYGIVSYSDADEATSETTSTLSEVTSIDNINPTIDLSENNIVNPSNIDNSVEVYQLFLQAMPSKRKKYLDDLELVEKEILDILHAIEFNSYSASNGFKMYKMLHDARCRRRKDKDMLLKINIISNAKITDWMAGKVASQINGMKNRKYVPRALDELFD
jgi:hypothetical protein